MKKTTVAEEKRYGNARSIKMEGIRMICNNDKESDFNIILYYMDRNIEKTRLKRQVSSRVRKHTLVVLLNDFCEHIINMHLHVWHPKG